MLIALGFCCLLLFLFASSFFATTFFHIRAERFFLVSLICNALLLYVAAIARVAYPGFLVIFSLNLALYVPCLYRMRKEGCRPVLERFLTPGVVFALIFLVLFFVCGIWRKFYTWDEISHWGAAAKLFMRDGKLGCEYGGILSHASYPPGTCLFMMLTHYCFFGVPFNEAIIRFGHELLLLGIWLYPLAGLTRERRWQAVVMCVAYLGFVPIFLREDFHTCYTDAPLACLFGLCVYAVLTLRRDSRYDIFALGILTSFLFMIRNAGFGYAIGISILLLIRLLWDRKELFSSRREITRALPVLAFSLALPFAVKYSWAFLLKYHNTPLKFGGTTITPGAIYDAFVHNIPSKSYTVLADFALRLLCGYALIFILLVVLMRILQKRSVSPERSAAAGKCMYFFIITFTGFLISMVILYIFEFNEKYTLPSFDRYVNAYLLAVAFPLLFLWHDEFAERSKNDPPEQNLGLGTVPYRRASFILICLWCFVATLWGLVPYPVIARWKEQRDGLDHVKKYDHLVSQAGVRFAVITSTGSGFKNFYGSYLYPENFRELKHWDPVIRVKSDDHTWMYVSVATPDEVRKEFLEKKLNYIFFEAVRKDFYEDYQSLFADGFTAAPANLERRLFRILPDGRLQPVD